MPDSREMPMQTDSALLANIAVVLLLYIRVLRGETSCGERSCSLDITEITFYARKILVSM
jgi:hypothetical protein